MSQDRKILYKKYNHRYKLFCPDKRNRYICFYCGLPAPTLDHVPPLNKVDDLLMEFEILIYTKVPACNECNRIASDEPHTDIYERQKYIKKKLKRKYHKYIKSPDWEEDEIEQLGYRMRQQIDALMSIKYLVAFRLVYGEDIDFKPTDLGYLQFDPRKILKYAEVDKWNSSFELVDENQTLEEVNISFKKAISKKDEDNQVKTIHTKNNYLSYNSFKSFILDKDEIYNGTTYKNYRKKNKSKYDNLHYDPRKFYEDVWEGWEVILGKKYKTNSTRIDKTKYLSYEEFKNKLLQSGVNNSSGFVIWRNSLSDEEKYLIPSAPTEAYSNEWKGWKSILGVKYKIKSPTKIDKKKYLSYEEFKNKLLQSGINNSSGFSKWRNSLSDEEKSLIPSTPHSAYSNEWEGWKDLLGKNYKTGQIKLDYKNMPKYKDFIAILKKANIKHANEFLSWRKNLPAKKKVCIPNNPVIHYADEWRGWHVLRRDLRK